MQQQSTPLIEKDGKYFKEVQVPWSEATEEERSRWADYRQGHVKRLVEVGLSSEIKSNKMQEQKLTVKSALAEGYKYYGEEINGEVLSMHKIEGIGAPDFADASDNGNKLMIFEKEATLLTISPEDIWQRLAEDTPIDQEIADEDEVFHDIIRDTIDWEEIANKLNAALATHPTYFPTKIELIP